MAKPQCAVIIPEPLDAREAIMKLIEPACMRHGCELVKDKDESQKAAISAPLGVAYVETKALRARDVDPRAILAVGYRLGANRPTILLEQFDESTDSVVPVIRKTVPHCSEEMLHPVKLPPNWNDDEQPPSVFDDIDAAMAEAKKQCNQNSRKLLYRQQGGHRRYKSHPFVEFRFNRNKPKQGLTCTAHSADAPSFFNRDHLVDCDATTLIDSIKPLFYLPELHDFLTEQDGLFAQLLAERKTFERTERFLWAHYPVVFDKHPNPEFNKRAFLPIIVSNSQEQDHVYLSVLYLDVNSVLDIVENNEAHAPKYVCLWKFPGPPLEFPEKTLSEGFKYHVFLAHNSNEKRAVGKFHDALGERGFKAWFDDIDMSRGEVIDQISRGITESEIMLVFIGQSGLGKWQGGFEVTERVRRDVVTRDRHNVIPVLLPGVDNVPAEYKYLAGYAMVRFESLDDLANSAAFDKLIRMIETPVSTSAIS